MLSSSPLLAEGLVDLVIQREEMLWRHGVQTFADVIVARNLLDLKEAFGIAAAFVFFQRLLRAQEGGGLSEKDREGTQANVLHRILGVLAGTLVGQVAQRSAQRTDAI